MAKDISVEMTLPLEDGAELLPELEKEAEKVNKEDTKALEKAADAVDDINEPKGVEVPKEIPIKVLTEKLILREDLDEDEFFDLSHDVYRALILVFRNWINNSTMSLDDFKRAVDNAIDHLDDDDSLLDGLDIEESDEHKSEDSEKLEEDFKVYSNLQSFKPWSGAIQTWSLIRDANKLDELDSLLEEVYPEGLSETELNDLLWFEPEWVLESLGISDEDMYSDED